MTRKRSIVDAHHHLWDLYACHYPWLMAKGVRRFFGDPTPIQKDYRVDDLRADARPLDLAGSVHVQVGVAPGLELQESRWLDAVSADTGLPSVIVAACELERPDVEEQLDAQQRIGRVCGVRQIVGRSDDEDRVTGSARLLEEPAWRAGLALLAARGLSFDLQLTPRMMPLASEVFGEIPELPVALCHCGSPWDQTPAGLEVWREGLERMAALPNAVCKLSGLGMFDHDWSDASVRPVLDGCLEAFGPERCMFGSNFPVDKLHATYARIVQALDKTLETCTVEEREWVYSGTARRFYRF